MKQTILYVTTFVAFFGAVSAHATGSESPKQVVVHYGDIDVNQASGAKVLLARIEAASSQVCETGADNRDLAARQVFVNCKSDAKERAIASLPFNILAKIDSRSDSEVVASR